MTRLPQSLLGVAPAAASAEVRLGHAKPLAAARKIGKADCKLGKVTKPRKVKRAPSWWSSSSRVAITLAAGKR